MKANSLWKNISLGAVATAAIFPGCNQIKENSKNYEMSNIIFILADDLGYGDIGCYGQEKIKTPNIDKLAREGIIFTQHYAGSTVCAPSRCCLMTGFHTGHTVVRGNKGIKPEGQFPMPEETVTVAELLKKAGYVTATIGKWGLGGPGSSGDPINQGFDYSFGYNCQSKAHFYYPESLWKNDEKVLLPENQDGKHNTYSHDLFIKEALKFITQNKDSSFFLYLPFTIPHAELLVPENSLDQYKGEFLEEPFEGGHYGAQETPRAAYAAMVSLMDEGIGKIMDLMKELEIDKNTLVIFTSDNGPHKEGGNDPDFFNSNGPFRGIKRDLYEGGIHVPFIVRWPDKIKPGRTSDHISAFWDFLPTVCDIANIEPPSNIDGISFLPELLEQEQPKHEYLYWEFHRSGHYNDKQAVRTGKWKAVRLNVNKNADADIELYNLHEDIGEENNIAYDFPEIVKKMREILKQAHTPAKEWPLFPEEFEAEKND